MMAEPLWDDSLLWAGEATCRSHPATVAGAFNMGLLKCLTRLAIHAPGAAVAVASGSDIGNPQELPHTVETSPGYLATKKKVWTRERARARAGAAIDHRQRRGRARQTERETVIIGEVGMH